MRKGLAILVVLAMLSQAGCATVQKKFTRKKKVAAHTASVIPIQEGPYQKPFSNDYYYKQHYTYWQTWHDELIKSLGGNGKKVARAAEEAVNNLSSLSGYLTEEKKRELEGPLFSLTRITARLGDRSYSESELGGLRVELEKIRRTVANDFYYERAKPFILADKVDLGETPQ